MIGSLVRHKGRIFLFYSWDHSDGFHTKCALSKCNINTKFQISVLALL